MFFVFFYLQIDVFNIYDGLGLKHERAVLPYLIYL